MEYKSISLGRGLCKTVSLNERQKYTLYYVKLSNEEEQPMNPEELFKMLFPGTLERY